MITMKMWGMCRRFRQVLIIGFACRYGNVHCIDTALDLFNQWAADPTNYTM